MQVESEQRDVDRAVDGTVRHPKCDEHPGRNKEDRVDLVGEIEVNRQCLEQERKFEQILEVVGVHRRFSLGFLSLSGSTAASNLPD